jgi:hypothetical protein
MLQTAHSSFYYIFNLTQNKYVRKQHKYYVKKINTKNVTFRHNLEIECGNICISFQQN